MRMSPDKFKMGARSRSFAWRASIVATLIVQAPAVRAVRSDVNNLTKDSRENDLVEELAGLRRQPQPSYDHLEKNSEGTVVHDIGIFSGLVLRSDFDRASFWSRDCEQHQVHHGKDDEDFEVFASSYNTCTGVSDIVYYSVHGEKFTSGNGRGGEWQNDQKLQEIMKQKGKKPRDYATISDYQGVGFFSIDRGHQAPVASLNVDNEAASMTNTPTNLSPQSAILNRNNWRFLEADMREKAEAMSGRNDVQDLEMLTGPIYELPSAMFQNTKGNILWRQLLEVGGEANQDEPWCKEREGPTFRSSVLLNRRGEERSEMTRCLVDGYNNMERASDDPNKLKISYQRSSKHFPLRAPLGYFKLMVMESGSIHGRRTCAFIMDQVGQCLLVSVELLAKLAHLDANHTQWALHGGLEVKEGSADGKYNAYVNPYWCVPPGSTLRRKNACLFTTNKMQDPTEITTELMDEYWSRQG
eukprot:TRINITY_DN22373_c0_g1_i1.p1 TRINITY_DN22373_c0_g1~~TRINITY_DN22373_c0_g1_i1.p1  ORF type:complete len:480 (+),score=74.16 TRINITY_DN22373_c0_g1_i1:33-1442(+)